MALLTAAPKIKASTLLETLTAMILIMMSFGIGVLVYISILSSENSMNKLNAGRIMQKMAAEIRKPELGVKGTNFNAGIHVQQMITPYRFGETSVSLLTLTGYGENNKELGTLKMIIRNREQ